MDIYAVENMPNDLKIEYADGSSEEIENGIYERKNSNEDTVEQRAATTADSDRMAALAAGFEAANPPSDTRPVKVEQIGSSIEITYADGSKEEISAGVYERKNAENDTIIERPATSADTERLTELAEAGPGGSPDDDGTPDQGSGDAPGTPPSGGTSDDDGTPDQGSGDAGTGGGGTTPGVHRTGDASDDRLRGSRDDDILEGEGGDDDLRGSWGDDTLDGGAGHDELRGGKGDDTIHGGDGEDRLRGDHGNDTMSGGAHDDRMYGGRGADYMSGDSGDDRMRGNLGGDEMDGGAGSDHMRGGGGGDTMSGGAGKDYVLGEGGSDHISGGAGDDNLYGGWSDGLGDGRQDTFIFSSTADGGGGYDRIRDFENGIDRIDLSAFGFSDMDQVLNGAREKTGDVILSFGNGDALRIDDTSLGELDASDFIL